MVPGAVVVGAKYREDGEVPAASLTKMGSDSGHTPCHAGFRTVAGGLTGETGQRRPGAQRVREPRSPGPRSPGEIRDTLMAGVVGADQRCGEIVRDGGHIAQVLGVAVDDEVICRRSA